MRHNRDPLIRDAASALAALRDAHSRGESDVPISLVTQALSIAQGEPEVLAFVMGRRRESVQHAWGDNDYSYWAHIYAVPADPQQPELLVTLESDGGVHAYVGLFSSRELALAALANIGSCVEP